MLGIQLTRLRRRQRAAAGDRPLWQLHSAAPTASRRSSLPDRRAARGRSGRQWWPRRPRMSRHDRVDCVRTGHAFLADIAHNAVPDGLADGDIEIGLGNRRRQSDRRLRQRTARRALHRRRRPRQREHRPDRRPPRVPLPSTTGWSSTPRKSCSPTPQRCWPVARPRPRPWPSSTSGSPSTSPPSRRQLPINGLDLGRRTPVPGREVRHRDAVPAPRVRGVRPQDPAEHQRLPGARRLRRHDRSVDRRRVRARGLSLRPLDADRDDRPLRPDLHRRSYRPDRRLPQPAQFQNNGTDALDRRTISPPAPSSAA